MSTTSAAALPAVRQRADWRFLLPALGPARNIHAYVPGPYDPTLEIHLRAVASHVSFGPVPGRLVALVVFRHPATFAEISTGAAALREGGVLYLEMEGRRAAPLTLARLSRLLKQAGFDPLNLYGVMPSLAAPRVYIPLALPHALRWYLDTMLIAGSPAVQAARRLLRSLPGLMNWAAPGLALFAIKGGGAARPLPALLDHPDVPREIARVSRSVAILTSGFDPGSRTILLPFGQKSEVPLATIKVAGDANLNVYTASEQQTLVTLHEQLPPGLRCAIPRPLGTGAYAGYTVSIESYARGRSSWMLLNERGPLSRKIELLQSAARWIAGFHRAMTRERVTVEEYARAWLFPMLERFAELDPENPARPLFERVRAYLTTLGDISLPVTWQHFDYAPWNLYQEDGQLTVIDWELGRPGPHYQYGPAGCDLLYFLKYWLHAVLRTGSVEEECQAFHFLRRALPVAVDNACQRALQAYIEEVEMDARLLPLLTVHTWVEQAIHSCQRIRSLSDRNPRAKSSQKAFHYVDALQRHVEDLFIGQRVRSSETAGEPLPLPLATSEQ